MSSDKISDMWVFGMIVLVVTCVVVLLSFIPGPTKHGRDGDTVEKFDMKLPTDFLIFNYFPEYPIKIVALSSDGREGEVLVPKIPPLKTGGLSRQNVVKYIQPGKGIRVYLLGDNTDRVLSDYFFTSARPIKNLHVGMITTRYIADTTDNLHMATTAANAVRGSAWLIIHNLTNIPLSFNDGEVTVQPKSTTRYLGYLNSGVTLGTIFKDDLGIFPEFQYLKPYNNLYYGVVSDTRQPLEGCLQVQFDDRCEYGQTLWPFEDGVI
jgi:hypothetical protein